MNISVLISALICMINGVWKHTGYCSVNLVNGPLNLKLNCIQYNYIKLGQNVG